MSAFYITEVKDKGTIKRSKSEEKKSLDAENAPQSPCKSTKSEFLEFLIHEETKFADLEKIENYYQSEMIKNYNYFNSRQNLIAKKKLELRQIEETIEQAIVSNVKIKEEDLVSYYDKQIEDLKQNIILKEHDLECYQHMYQRLYKANVSFKNYKI